MPKKTPPRITAVEDLELSQFVPYRLATVSNRVSGIIARDYADRFALTIPQWRVMTILSQNGQCSSVEIATATQMDKVAVSRAVKGLVARDLVSRRTNRADKRVADLSLTAEGLALFNRIAPQAKERERQILGALSGQERATLLALLDQLDHRLNVLDDEADGAASLRAAE